MSLSPEVYYNPGSKINDTDEIALGHVLMRRTISSLTNFDWLCWIYCIEEYTFQPFWPKESGKVSFISQHSNIRFNCVPFENFITWTNQKNFLLFESQPTQPLATEIEWFQ